ncbi:hypothetical protein E4L96_17325 [Massilia arenosa]|uniref:Peptidase A2 domain-containing protein n=1 Tax=Zemynaea arenosa TaxID=2561931 RepID=A0A4Y9S813_9BURK|nr:retropepsin-like aspartic protease [Massilia arenosa]TFW15871.1 hypothetical protein E4L96_17325 [Massilia arenosa]
MSTRFWLAGLLFGAACASRAADVNTLLAQTRSAYGPSASWERVRFLRAEGEQSGEGLTGKVSWLVDRASGQFKRSADVGDYRAAEGMDAQGRWRQDGSGGWHPLDSDEAKAVAVSEAWLARMAWLDRQDRAVWSGGDEVTEQGVTLDRIVAAPPHGRAVTLYLDHRTHLVQRAEMPISTSTWVQRYEGYHAVGGLTLPARISTNSDGDNDVLLTVSAWSTPASVEASAFARPAWKANASPTVTVPITIGKRLLINATIDGKGPFPFVLDTGGQAILTKKAAAALGLTGKQAGELSGVGGASVSTASAMVRDLNIGGAALHDVPFLIFPMPPSFSANGDGPEVAGVLGLEVFEQFAVRFDFPRGTATLTPLATYRGELDGAVKVPLRFTEDVPLVAGAINGSAGWFAVDTGNNSTFTVQGKFARAHGLDKAFEGGRKITVKSGVGSQATHYAGQLARVELGSIAFENLEAAVAYDEAGPFSSTSEAANLGLRQLKDYIVTFDYRNGTMSLARPQK